MYRIAVGSSDGTQVDLKFGEVTGFLIYEVDDVIRLAETRSFHGTEEAKCGQCSGGGGGCNGSSDVVSKIALLEDCRCVVCKKIGFQAQKQLEKKAISVFDVECGVEEALDKITYYFEKIDKHESFRRQSPEGVKA